MADDPRSAGNLSRPLHEMPQTMREALDAAGLMEAYRARPAYQQNDYIWWIASPKRETTQRKRLEQMLNELRAGDVYMAMAWRGKGG